MYVVEKYIFLMDFWQDW